MNSFRLIFCLLITFCFSILTSTAAGGDTLSTFQKLTIKPKYPENIDTYILHHLRYPELARENAIEGGVVVRFLINEHGEITNIKRERSSGNNALDLEALRVVKSMRKWQPGYYKKRPIRVVYMLPITFRLD